jgi:hypothetical protein
MTEQQILSEVSTSDWQPEFEFTDDIDAAVDSILISHEDYFLGLHSKVKEIIDEGINYFKCDGIIDEFDEEGDELPKPCCRICGSTRNSYGYCTEFTKEYREITFADMCNWQKELFEHKKRIIDGVFDMYVTSNLNQWEDANIYEMKYQKTKKLPNLYLDVANKLGLRNSIVTVGKYTPPHPIYLEDLKDMCFPISIYNQEGVTLGTCYEGTFNSDEAVLIYLTDWYRVFQTIHFFNDLNGRIGGIAINVLSYLLTGKYMINVKYGLNKSILND